MIEHRDSIHKSIGGLITANRLIRSLTLYEVAKRSGINIRELEAIENGEIDFTATIFNNIYRAMDIDLVMIIEMRKEMIGMFNNSINRNSIVKIG